jgi:hypothetical protein
MTDHLSTLPKLELLARAVFLFQASPKIKAMLTRYPDGLRRNTQGVTCLPEAVLAHSLEDGVCVAAQLLDVPMAAVDGPLERRDALAAGLPGTRASIRSAEPQMQRSLERSIAWSAPLLGTSLSTHAAKQRPRRKESKTPRLGALAGALQGTGAHGV